MDYRPLERCSPCTRLVLTTNLSPVHSERGPSQNETNSQRPGRHHCVKGVGSRGPLQSVPSVALACFVLLSLICMSSLCAHF